jgi:myo-inositol 2-dehydrogenase / D-chiro-inositol 1-dehydrogenase
VIGLRSARIGIGFLGAGIATQAIHVPTLATRPELFRIAAVMDVDGEVAERVAARVGARATTDERSVVEDPAVDVVVICTPDRFHAAQVALACAAGKRVVLCEKPLATSRTEAAEIRAAAGDRTAVIAGTMHAFDPAWLAARAAWQDQAAPADLVRSVIRLPPNQRFIDLATEPVAPVASGERPPMSDADVLRQGVLGLAVHDLPLVRAFAGEVASVAHARRLEPFGYVITLRGSAADANLIALMGGAWDADWTLEVLGPGRRLELRQPPAFVLAGSAHATLRRGSTTTAWWSPQSGYEAEWDHVARVLREIEPGNDLDGSLADLYFTLDIADAVAEEAL